MKRVIKSTEISEGNKIVSIFPTIINALTGIIESFLLIKILLRLFGANAQNVFVKFIYSVSDFFAKPFSNIFKNIEIKEGMILEVNTLIAMVVYALIAWIIISVFFNLDHKHVKEEVIDIHHE